MNIQNQYSTPVVTPPPAPALTATDIRTGLSGFNALPGAEPLRLINLDGTAEPGLLAFVAQYEQELRAFFQNLLPREASFLNSQTGVQSSLQLSDLDLSSTVTQHQEMLTANKFATTGRGWESLLPDWAHSALITGKSLLEELGFAISFQQFSDRGQSILHSSLMNFASPFQDRAANQLPFPAQGFPGVFQESLFFKDRSDTGNWQLQKARPIPYERSPRKQKETNQPRNSILSKFTQRVVDLVSSFFSYA